MASVTSGAFVQSAFNAAAEAARLAAEAAQRAAAEAAQRAAAEAAQRAAAEAAQRAAAEAARRAVAPQDTFTQSTASSNRPVLSPSTETASASTLRTEDIHDGQANCLDGVGDWLEMCPPELLGRTEVLFLNDTRAGAEGMTGHVVICQGDQIFDPATQQWMDESSYFSAHPEYQIAGTASGTAVNRILQAPPGPEREEAIAQSGIDPALFDMAVADGPEATTSTSGAGMLMLSPATLQAMQAYQANPTEANFDAFVQALAVDQLASQDAGLAEAQQRLAGGDLTAWADLATAAAEATQLANFLANGPHARELLESSVAQLCALAATIDPSLANVTVDQVLADPALAARLRETALTVAQAQFAEPQPNGAEPRADQNLTAFLDFDFGLATLGPEGYAAQGLTLDQAMAMAQSELAAVTSAHPELSVLDEGELINTFFPADTQLGLSWTSTSVGGRATVGEMNWADGDPTGGQYLLMQNISAQGGDACVPFLQTLDTARSEIATLQSYFAAGQNLPTAQDLRPMAMVALQMLGASLGSPEATQADYQAFTSAFSLMQGYEQQDRDQAMRDAVIGGVTLVTTIGFTIATGGFAAPVAASWVMAGYGAISTGGMLYGAFRRVENFSQDSYRSQFAGGGISLSGVPQPDSLEFGLGMALDVLGLALQGMQLAHAMELATASRALQGLENLDEAGRLAALATLFPEGTAMEVLAEIADGSRSYASLSAEAKTALAEWAIMSDEAYGALNLSARADDLLTVFRETVMKGRNLEAALAAGDITAEQASLWATRPSSTAWSGTIVNGLTNVPPLTPQELIDFRQILKIPASVSDEVVQQTAAALQRTPRFASAFNVYTQQYVTYSAIDIARNLNGQCGEVAKVMAEMVGGNVTNRWFPTDEVFFGHPPNALSIATGMNESPHAFAVDSAGYVWDPITGVLGNMTVEQYLAQMTDASGNVVTGVIK